MLLRQTKIIATIGPASENPVMLRELIIAGINLVRINMSHGSSQRHSEVINQVRKIAQELNVEVGVLIDLQGPKIRIARFKNSEIILNVGDKFILDAAFPDDAGDQTRVGIDYKNLIQDDDKPFTQEIKDFVVNLFNSQPKKINNQQSEVPMKKLFAVFPLLFAVLAIQNKEEEFDETKGRVLSNDEMKLVEAQISELNALKAEKTAWDAEKTTLNASVTSLTTERNDFKAKYENTPAFKGEKTGDDKDKDSYAAKQKENPMYATVKEEYGME